MAGPPWHRPSPGARAAPAGERPDAPAARARPPRSGAKVNGRARSPARASGTRARPRSQRTGSGRLSDSPKRREGGKEEGRRGRRSWGRVRRRGRLGAAVRCVRLCGGAGRPSEAGRWHSRTRAYLWPRARAHSLALLGRSPAVSHPVRAPAQTFLRGSERRCEAFAARSRTLRARSRPVPSELHPVCGWGRCGRDFLSLARPHFPHFVVAIGVRRREESRAARLGVSGKLACRPCASPVLTPARRPPRSRRPAAQKFPPLRSAFAFRKDPESHHVKAGYSSPRAFLFPPPSLLPSQFLGNLLR